MKKLAVVLAAALCLGACGEKKETSAESQKPVVKIGATLPLSGDAANVGEVNRKTIQMAFDKWQSANTKYAYELVFENDMLQPKQIAAATNKLINADKVNAIISLWGIAAPIVADAAAKKEIVHLTCAGMSHITDSEYTFNNYTQNKELFDLLIKKLQKEGVRKVAFVFSNNPVSEERSDFIKEAFKNSGIEVAAIEKYNPGTKDFRLSIANLEQLKPDYYVAFVLYPDIVNFVEQFKQVTKGKNNLAAIDVFHEMPRQFWPIANGLWFVKSNQGTAEFAKQLKTATGEDIQSCAGNSYDNLDLLIWAYENAPVKDGQRIPENRDVVQKLKSVKNRNGAIGNFSIGQDGIIRSQPTLQKMLDGEQAEIKE